MPDNILDDISHRRYNPLLGSWLLVSPHRTKRPWLGQQEPASNVTLPAYDPACYLCPGNKRAEGTTNPAYDDVFVFVNDYSAVKETQAAYAPGAQHALAADLLRVAPVTGKCFVLTFSAQHNVTLADMTAAELRPVVDMWTAIYAAHLSPASPLAEVSPATAGAYADVVRPTAQYTWMQIFENKGAAMGCSNPHPHCQIWTTTGLPSEPAAELEQLMAYRRTHDGRGLLQDYVALELAQEERIVYQNAAFLVVCPWWATWPFEVLLISKTHKRGLVDFDAEERLLFAEAVVDIARRYDNLFETFFPYSSGIHQAPLDGTAEQVEASWFHMHFYPPLLRSASVRKFLVGYELMAEPQRDITPEQAAARLRNCGGALYRD